MASLRAKILAEQRRKEGKKQMAITPNQSSELP